MAASPEAVRLAMRLRNLRESRSLTQAALASALSDDTRVAMATISSWESLINPKLPSAERLRSYALFFSQAPAPDDTSQLPREWDLPAAERERFHELHQELIGLRDATHSQVGHLFGSSYTFEFERGPVTIICSEAPASGRSPLADERNPNHTRGYRYADLDALIELWGHVRASNPELMVAHRLPGEVVADDLSGDLIVLGGIAWNLVANRLQEVLNDVPLRQVIVPDFENGEIFRSSDPDGQEFRPRWEDGVDTDQAAMDAAQITAAQAEDAWRGGKPRELAEDVALLVRRPNPFNHSRTITICNGVYSRGVLGSVRALTDIAVRDRNEVYIANRFPDGSFVLLMRVPVLNGQALSPDLEMSEYRLYEWPPARAVHG